MCQLDRGFSTSYQLLSCQANFVANATHAKNKSQIRADLKVPYWTDLLSGKAFFRETAMWPFSVSLLFSLGLANPGAKKGRAALRQKSWFDYLEQCLCHIISVLDHETYSEKWQCSFFPDVKESLLTCRIISDQIKIHRYLSLYNILSHTISIHIRVYIYIVVLCRDG